MPQISFEQAADFHVEKETMKVPMAMMHYHNAFELYYLVRGDREYFIGDEFYKLSEGDIVLIPPTVLHRTAGKGAARFLVHFTREHLLRFFTNEALAALPLDRPTAFRVEPTVRDGIERDLSKMLADFQSSDGGITPAPLLVGYLYRILFTLTTTPNSYVAEAFADARVGQIVRYVNENYASIRDIDEIAERFFISKFYLCRIFNKSLGLPLITYLNTIKIRAACELMQKERLTITEVATRCGFNSSSYFCKVFRGIKGVSPTAYRAHVKQAPAKSAPNK